MQRRLIVMRHADSAWDTGPGSDHERVLTSRGRHEAPKIAQALTARGWKPDAVLSSDARRTQETWEEMSRGFDGAPEPTFTRALYHAGLEAVWEAAHAVGPELRTLLVLGHNPGWEQAVHRLTGQPESMTPANAALLEGSGDDWPAALEGRWRLVEVLRPGELADR